MPERDEEARAAVPAIKAAELDRGRSKDRAEEIAARTVNKQRREAGETEEPTR
jgi:hypothetical protein